MAQEEWLRVGYLGEFSIVAMALAVVDFSSLEAFKYIKSVKEKGEIPGWPPLSVKGALAIPFKAAVILLLLYLYAKYNITAIEDYNLDTNKTRSFFELKFWLVEGYSLALAISNIEFLSPLVSSLVSLLLRNMSYRFSLKKGSGEGEEFLIDMYFTIHGIISFLCCFGMGIWYNVTKSWIVNNMIAVPVAILAIKHFHLNSMKAGCTLLVSFIIFDVYFVCGTDVMKTVAMLYIPKKLVFPSDIILNGLDNHGFYMLGLGDIIIPGSMISFLLRFNLSLRRNSLMYYYTSLVSYIFGLVIMLVVEHFTQQPQPGLLYLVPCTLIPTLALAYLNGDVEKLFKYEDYPQLGGNKDE